MVIGQFLFRGVDLMLQIKVPLVYSPSGLDTDTIHYLHIQPPFLDRVAHAVAEGVIKPDGDGHQDGFYPANIDAKPGGDPGHQGPLPGNNLVQGTHLHTAPASQAFRVCYTISGAAFYIRLPHFISIEHHFVPPGDGIAGALSCTLPAIGAEILQTKVNWLIWLKGQVCCKNDGLESGTNERIQDHFPQAGSFWQLQ